MNYRNWEDEIIAAKNVKELGEVLKQIPKTKVLRINGWSQATNKMYDARKKIFGNIVKIAGTFFNEGSYNNSASSDSDSGTTWKPIAKSDVEKKLKVKFVKLQAIMKELKIA